MRARLPQGSRWTTTLVAFVFMFNFATFPRGLENCHEVGVAQNPPLENCGPVGLVPAGLHCLNLYLVPLALEQVSRELTGLLAEILDRLERVLCPVCVHADLADRLQVAVHLDHDRVTTANHIRAERQAFMKNTDPVQYEDLSRHACRTE